MTTVVCVRKKELNKRGIADFEEWEKSDNTVYIGRNMSFYVKGATQSKWANPYSVKKYGREECLKMYREYILNKPELLNDLESLRGKELGCWCTPDPCHGNILVELINKKN